jgi:hypothetical protein
MPTKAKAAMRKDMLVFVTMRIVDSKRGTHRNAKA